MDTKDRMRVFFAVEFSESVKQSLYTMQQEVKKACRSGNFTHRDNFHLTLRFIGEAGPSSREGLKQAMDAAALRTEPFQISVQSLGHFPRGTRHIVWAGIAASSQLNEMYSCLEEELEARGVPKEGRGYTPHITLGREVALDSSFSDIAASVAAESMIVPVNRISLMQSTKINGQLRYIPLDTSEFSNSK